MASVVIDLQRPHGTIRSRLTNINGHAGLDWNYLLTVDSPFSRVPGSVNALMSDLTVAYNRSGHPARIAAGPAGRLYFAGAYFGIAWPAAEGEILHVEA